ncbi:hypothetical protein HB364_13825 [Pseudoflavitalea sp. X16]|uniref:hypothetical protein n=1 Tax=Paraflavitalea devenefica TaxID=2716334 RepID=UPI001423E676|nr:hypothetical protein [Paraflavitalea devenefica]NII26167.1 hypothetical protein [Paraflavitalea devenefica]
MTPEQQYHLDNEHKYAGFGTRLNQQVVEQVAQGLTQLDLRSQDVHGMDRMFYKVSSRIGDTQAFYNGFEAIIIKNMPANFKVDGLDLKDLEIRLSAPPQPFHGKNDPAGQFEKVLEEYQVGVKADMAKLYHQNKDLFYKVAFAYKEVLEPLIKADRKAEVDQGIAALMGNDIRKQWFPADQGITRVEAFNLLDEIDHQRAVYKTYRVHEKKGGEEAATAPVQSPEGESATKEARKTYGVWLLLDYVDVEANHPEGKLQNPTKHGNRLLERIDDNYGFDIRAVLPRFGWKGTDSDKVIDDLAKALEKGNKVEVAPIDQSKYETVFIYANPRAKTITIEDHEGNRLPHAMFLTEAARQERSEKHQNQPFNGHAFRVANRPTQKAAGAGEEGEAHEKKNSNPHARIVQDGKGKGHGVS